MAYIAAADVAAQPNLSDLWATLSGTGGSLSPVQTAYLNAASAQVDTLTGQGPDGLTLKSRTYTTRMDRNSDIFRLPNKPVLSVSSVVVTPPTDLVTTLDVSTAGTVILSGGQTFTYIWPQTPSSGYINQRPGFPFQEGDVVAVSYTSGFNPIPDDVKQAAMYFLSSLLYAISENGSGASQVRQGMNMVTYGTTVLMDRNYLLAQMLLQPYTLLI